MIHDQLKWRHLILASESPRRQFLLKELGLDFEICPLNVSEVYPEGLQPEAIARYLAKLKAGHFDTSRLKDDAILITADTIVSVNGEILGKPADPVSAAGMLKKLSGRKHEVITAVCLKSKTKTRVFHALTTVTFKKLSDSEISYYIDHFRPYDKAGSYGVQEWIGYIGIAHINGSFFNVMGLPVKELYEELLLF